MTAVGCDTVEVNPPQHSIKQREKCGLGTEATSIKNRLVGSGTPPCSSRETLDPGVVPVGRLDLQGSLPPAACTAVLHTLGELFCRLLRCMSLLLAPLRHARLS